MSQVNQSAYTVGLQLKAIELLKSSIDIPNGSNVPLTTFNFNINLESRVDGSKKMIFVIVSVEIKSEDQKLILGSIMVSCVFEISNFDEIIKTDAAGRFEIPNPLIEILNTISISTVRGVMFATFKGTFLHNALLPVINPGTLQSKEPE